jgi:hypothetical protein
LSFQGSEFEYEVQLWQNPEHLDENGMPTNQQGLCGVRIDGVDTAGTRAVREANLAAATRSGCLAE